MHQHERRSTQAAGRAAAEVESHSSPPGRSPPLQLRATAGPSTGEVHEAARHGISEAAEPLPFLGPIQRAFGRHDVSGIKAHSGAAAQAGARAMAAEAFATGDHVAFGATPTLHTAAHEAAHVVQQRAGVSLKGGVGAQGDVYERHADEVADRVVRGESAEALLDLYAGSGGAPSGGTVQQKKPGEVPSSLEAQLQDRLKLRSEAQGEFPKEEELVDDVDTLLFQRVAPPGGSFAQQLVDKGIAAYQFEGVRSHIDSLHTLFSVLSNCALKAKILHPNQRDPIAKVSMEDIERQIIQTVQPMVQHAVRAWCLANGQPSPSPAAIRATYHISGTGAREAPTAKASRYVADHPQILGFTGTLSKPQEDQLRAALLTMTTVQRAFSGKHDDVAALRAEGSVPVREWLHPEILVDDGSEFGHGTSDSLIEEHSVPESMRARIQQACVIVCSLVEQRTLAHLGQPVIYVHVANNRSLLTKIREGDFSAAKHLRAFSESYVKAIHVDQTDSVETIVHEIGHQLENQLPSELWLDLQRLLRGRHQQAVAGGASNTLVSIYPSDKNPEVRQEAAYRAVMPATGAYSAKQYDGPGATEVMSMSMEFLANPKTAKTLLTQDPLQAAIVLRGIAPQEFATKVPAPLQALLPS